MAAVVVDRLETIEIHIADSVRPWLNVDVIEQALQAALEFTPVEHACQRVVARFIGELGRLLVGFGNICQRPLEINQPALCIGFGARILEYDNLAAILFSEHQLRVAYLPFLVDCLAPGRGVSMQTRRHPVD